MKASVVRTFVGMVLAGTVSAAIVSAEEEPKSLPTLLIKGEVVSLNTADPSATLLTVKDRYGFETPIYLAPETTVTQGEAMFEVANLTSGSGVEVEYNFDVNTAKRRAVSVKVMQPSATASAAAPAAAPAAMPAEAAPVVAPAAEASASATPMPEAPEASVVPAPPSAEAAATQPSQEAAPATQ